jgi:general secretion pathway protein D
MFAVALQIAPMGESVMLQGTIQRHFAIPLWRIKRWLPAVLAASFGTSAIAQDKPLPPPAAVQPAAPAAAPEKTVTFSFDGKPWSEVLDWFKQESGLAIITTFVPTGSAKISSDPKKKYTIPEVVDVLNEALAAQNFIIVRRERSFGVYPADVPPPPGILPTVDADDLKHRGKTELVRCTITVKTVLAEQIVPEIKKLLTKGFGTVESFGASLLIITDKVSNLENIIDKIKKLEGGIGLADTLSYECKYIRAAEAANQLKVLLKTDVQVTGATGGMSQFPGGFNPGGFNQGFPGGFDPSQFSGRGDNRRGRDGGNSNSSTAFGPRVDTVSIVVQDDSNSVFMTGPADKISLAKDLLEKIDKGDVLRPKDRAKKLEFYTVPAGTVPQMAKILRAQFTGLSVEELPLQNQITIYGTMADHLDVVRLLSGSSNKGSVTNTEIIPSIDPGARTKGIQTSFATAITAGMIVEQQADGVLIKGTADQIAEVRKYINLIEGVGPQGNAPGSNPNFRVFTLDKGNAAILAEGIKRVLENTGQPVELINPNAPIPKPAPKREQLPPGGKESMAPGRDVQYVSAQIADPQAKPAAKSDKKPVTITVQGNKLILTSEDPKALETAAQLLRIYTSSSMSEPSENVFEVIRIKNVSAEEAAKTINEIFNGPAQAAPGGGGGRGGFNPIALLTGGAFGGGGGAAPTTRVRVVAEKASNSVIIMKASPLDQMAIRSILTDVIEAGPADSDAIPRTYYITLKSAPVASVAQTLKDVFKEQTGGSNQRGGRGGGGRQPQMPFPFPGMPQAATTSTESLNIGTDEQTNTLIVNCPKAIYEEVEYLCKFLDDAASNSTEVVKVVPVTNIDPLLLQDAIFAMQGITPPNRSQPQGGFGFPGGNFGGGNRGGGFQGGNFGGGNRGGAGGFPGGAGGFQGGNRGGVQGGGFPGGAGGGRGAGPGGGGGGGNRGGGNQGGGGRGGQGGGRGGRSAMADPSPGGGDPRPFADADMDVPPARPVSTIYDPYEEEGYEQPVSHQYDSPPGLQQVQAALPQPVPLPDNSPSNSSTQAGGQPPVTAPRGNVTVQPIPELGVLILKARNQQELDEVMKLIEIIIQNTKTAQLKLEIIPMKHQDCGSITNLLSQIFSRVNFGAGGTSLVAGQQGFGGFGGGFGGQFGGQQARATVVGQLYFLPLPRFNAIFVVAPEARMPDVKAQIEQLDQPNGKQLAPKKISLKRAAASIVAQQITNFFNNRYTQEQLQTLQLRVQPDVSGNSVIVQAGPADMADIESLIAVLDSSESTAINQLKVIRIKNGLADQIAQVVGRSLSLSALNPQQSLTGGTAALTGGAGGGFGGGGLGGGGFQTGQFGQGNAGQIGGGFGGQQGGFGGLGGATQVQPVSTFSTKANTLQFYSPVNNKMVESGLLEDVHLVADVRINSILVSAPERTMKLIEAVIAELDTFAAAQGSVKVFKLNKADATNIANLLLSLFARAQQQQGGLGGGGFGGGGFGGGGFGGGAQQQQQGRPVLNLVGEPVPGATLIDLRILPDTRTNSIIVAGSQNDLETIMLLIDRLDNVDSVQQKTEVIRLRNTAAVDVATAVNTFLSGQAGLENTADQVAITQAVGAGGVVGTSALIVQRNFGIVAEPISNVLLISGTPGQIEKIKGIIDIIDIEPAQVLIQVVVAEVTLRSNEEFGVEIGLQTPTIFNRGVGAGGSPGIPGFNFNTTAALSAGLPNTNLYKQETVGFQGLGNLGVGRSNGGFVFSAANDTFNLLIRALKTQGRVEVLSRPQLTLLDNQFGTFQVGQQFPRPAGSTNTQAGVTADVEYVDTGVVLNVTPRISPEGKVFMRIQPSLSSPNPTPVVIGNGFQAFPIDTTGLETSVVAMDGETIVLGGLIRKSDTKGENKVPVLGDLPYVGAAFRYRTQTIERREIIFIMTPHILRTPADRMRLLAEEAGRVSWNLANVKNIHGYGHEALSGQTPFDQPAMPAGMWCYPNGQYYPTPAEGATFVPAQPGQLVPNQAVPFEQAPAPTPQPGSKPLGTPTPLPPANPPGSPPMGIPMGTTGGMPSMLPGSFPQTVQPPAMNGGMVPASIPTMNGGQPMMGTPAAQTPPGLVPAGAIWYQPSQPVGPSTKSAKPPVLPTKKSAKEGDKWVFPGL